MHPTGVVESWDEATKTAKRKGELSQQHTQDAFEAWAYLVVEKGNDQSPGNMNYRITRVTEAAKLTIRWSDANVPSNEVDNFYKKYYQLMRSAKELE